jgi:hypothetical protein
VFIYSYLSFPKYNFVYNKVHEDKDELIYGHRKDIGTRIGTCRCAGLQTGNFSCSDASKCPASAHLVGTERLAVMSRNTSLASDSCHREAHGPDFSSTQYFLLGSIAGKSKVPLSRTAPSPERDHVNFT